jgi:uncharacterized protein (DUF1499 family)
LFLLLKWIAPEEIGLIRHNPAWNKDLLLIGALILFVCCVLCKPLFSEEPGSVKLAPCPSSPNCISTQSNTPDQYMEPLPYAISAEESRSIIRSIIESMPRSKVLKESENYIHAEFRSLIFRFVDDVEFLFDEKEKTIHFRSASRTGYSDFGVNRRRMQNISERYLVSIQK